ncbi:MAG TPA: sensor domain-containing diguanylate cyclase, partial [Thermomicrobiales bacterium]|nr:sensor domain-containing diguanylate cyclase [Thermomicrobiales bacterium]
FASPSTESVLGFEPSMLEGEHVSRLLSPADHHLVDHLVATVIASPRATATMEFQFVRNDGITRWFEVVGTNMLDVSEVSGIALQARDVSDRKRMEELLATQALLDPLTGLLNRRGIVDRIDRALARHGDGPFPHVAFIDLDGFKEVNDTFGHQVGDETLVATARRILDCLDGHGHAARLGGDEFVVLVEDVCAEDALALFARIQEYISTPMEIEGELWELRASIGIAGGAGGAVTTTSLLHDADVALYQMKGDRSGTPIRAGSSD